MQDRARRTANRPRPDLPPSHPLNLPSPGAYARQWRKVIEFAAADAGKSPAPVYSRSYGEYKTAAQYRADYLKALQNRINERGQWNRPAGKQHSQQGKKASDDEFFRFYRDAAAIRAHNNSRVRVYQFETPAARRRFSHILSSRADD